MSTSTAPKHQQIEHEIRSLIRGGHWGVGYRLPSEINLASEYACSAGTVRRALSTLIQEGHLRPKRRSGVYVQEKPRQRIIGVMVPSVVNPDHAGLVQAVTQSAGRRGYTVTLFCSTDDWRNYVDDKRPQFQFVERFADLHPTGVICTPTHVPNEAELRQRMRRLGLPNVVVNDFWTDCENDHHVYVDQAAAARLAVDHLVELGHRRIAMLMHPDDQWPQAEMAFKQQLASYGLPTADTSFTAAAPHSWVKSCLSASGDEQVTAAVVPYHERSRSFIEALGSVGIDVPGDFSVVCLGGQNRPAPQGFDLTSTINPMDKVAERALDVLLDRQGDAVCHFKYKPALHAGATTAPCAERTSRWETTDMLKGLIHLMLVTTWLLLGGGCLSSASYLVRDNRPQAEIVIASTPPRMTKLAAEELQSHLAAITGATLPIVNEPTASTPFQIYVGESAFTMQLGIRVDDLSDGAYRQISGDGWLALVGRDTDFVPPEIWAQHYGYKESMYQQWDARTGAKWTNSYGMSLYRDYSRKHGWWAFDERGSLNAVCDFLRDQGVRWYMPGKLGTILPSKSSITVGQVNRVVHPDFGLRYQHHSMFGSAGDEDILWYLHQGFNQHSDFVGPAMQQSHGLGNLMSRPEMAEAHPEYYALWGGKRMTEDEGKPCLSSEGLFQENVRYLRAVFDIYDLPMLSVMPQDGYGSACQCELCAGKSTPERGWHGTISNYVWDYVNRVAIELYKSHPDKKLSCFAYGTYLLPPTNIDHLSPNLVVGIVKGRSGQFRDPDTRKLAAEIRQQWLDLSSNKLLIWEHYVFTHRGTITPAFFPHAIADGLKATKGQTYGEIVETAIDIDHGKGLHLPGFNHLNVYTTARLYWDADRDVDALLDEYYRLYYGPAAKPMKAYIADSEAHWQDLMRDVDGIARNLQLFEAVKNAADPASVYGQRIALIDDYLNGLRNLYAQLAKGRENVPEARAADGAADVFKIDGKLDEAAWQKAVPYKLLPLVHGATVTASTTFRMVWTGGPKAGTLHVGITCEEPAMDQLLLPDAADSTFWLSDTVEFLLETQAHSYYQLAIAPNGIMFDLDRRNTVDARWESGATFATQQGENGWTIELSIPVSGADRTDDPLHDVIGQRPTRAFPWYFNLCRQRPRDAGTEYSGFSPTGEEQFHNVMKFGKLYVW